MEKYAHAPARMFSIEKRGFIRPGYKADLVLVNPNDPWTVARENILYKCQWSPFEGHTFNAKVKSTWVNGNLVYDNGEIIEGQNGQRMTFDR